MSDSVIFNSVNVNSEIGQLKKVLLHKPGNELEHLTPEYMDRLLFDDIPFLKRAAEEHDAFAKALRDNGTEVIYLTEVVTEVISKYGLRDEFIHDFIETTNIHDDFLLSALNEYLSSITSIRDLVLKTMEGISYKDLNIKQKNSLSSLTSDKEWFATDPIPNLYFTRDPMAILGKNLISLNSMFYATRKRESLYVTYATLKNAELSKNVKFVYLPTYPYSIEGGDLLVLSNNVLAVGLSQRTGAPAIDLLTKTLFSETKDGCTSEFKHIIAVDIPNMRAFMHLDTVLTQADKGVFVVHPQVEANMRFYIISKVSEKKSKVIKSDSSLENIFLEYLNLDKVNLIKCGGNSPIASAREQWNDGSNALCIKPKNVIVYDRNTITNNILSSNGLNTIPIPSSELSRGRGGPRCMAMPLCREDV